MNPRAWCLLLSVSLSGCVTLAPERRYVVVPLAVSLTDPSIRWYDIGGDSRFALRDALDRAGPLDADGVRHDAHTDWFVTWHFPFVDEAQGCKLGPVNVTLRTSVTLPRWYASASTDPELVERWRDYLAALWLHESGHRETGARAAGEIETLLPTLPAKESCVDAETAANEAAQGVLTRHRQADRDYDETTQHGAMQGATFSQFSY